MTNAAAPRGEERPPCCLLALPAVRWPGSMRPLAEAFACEPPCAPFDAPGWRFIRMRLPPGAPTPLCYAGRRIEGGRVTEVVYALSSPPDRPPGDRRSWRYVTGRHGEGLWALHQPLDNSPQSGTMVVQKKLQGGVFPCPSSPSPSA